MTRINLIEPKELCDQYLIAELRELPRIPNGLLKGKLQLSYSDISDKFVLGKGHVKFFTNKLAFLHSRYLGLLDEALLRGFNVINRFPEEDMLSLPLSNLKEYHPTIKEIRLSRERILQKLPKNARYYGKRYEES